MLDLCIIGCGASAMAAAIAFGENAPSAKAVILEKKEQPGKKLAASGNGKCNLSNINCPGAAETLEFFRRIGVQTREDAAGRIYPYSEQAGDVVFALKRRIKQLGIEIVTGCTAEKVTKKQDGSGFCIKAGGRIWETKKVLLASGGKAAPQFGTSGDGYGIARSLGHEIKKLAPVLTALECSEISKREKGVRAKAAVTLKKDGQPIFSEKGEVQFTEDGLSGICIFNLSRLIKSEPQEPFPKALKRYGIAIDFLPETDRAQAEALLRGRWEAGFSEPRELLLTLVPEKLMGKITERVRQSRGKAAEQDGKDRPAVPGKEKGIDGNAALTAEQAEKLAAVLKNWELPVSGVKGWKNAQCTAGGVSLAEINRETMESKLVKDLYFAGEVTDYDGPCGGYNLQYAWETGIKAGRAMSERR